MKYRQTADGLSWRRGAIVSMLTSVCKPLVGPLSVAAGLYESYDMKYEAEHHHKQRLSSFNNNTAAESLC